MAKQFDRLEPQHIDFIARQHLFFTASAVADGRVNLSPKGLGGFRVLGPSRVCWLDLTGSGAETAAHLLHDGRLTVMFCAFEGVPLILRLFGRGASLLRGSLEYRAALAESFDDQEPPGARQIVLMDVDLVQTSCGFGVPLYDYQGERDSLIRWAEMQGEDGLIAYRQEKNAFSLDGLPTGIV